MDPSAAVYVAVCLVLAAIMGAAFARWRRALSDWRKTVASIPVQRKTTFSHFVRMVVFGGGLLLVMWVMARGNR